MEEAKKMFCRIYPEGVITNAEEVNGKYVFEVEFSDGIYYHVVTNDTISRGYDDYFRAISSATKLS